MPIDTNLGPVESHGATLNTPIIQEDAVLNEDGLGLRMLNGSLRVKDRDNTSTLTGSNLPKIGDEIIKGSGLYLSKIAKRYKWCGDIIADFEAVGIDPAYNGVTDIAWEGASTASSEPIESHWQFKSKIGGTAEARMNGAVFDPENGKFLGFSTVTEGTTVTSDQPLAGVRSYLAPKETNRGYIHASTVGGKGVAIYSKLKGSIGTASYSGSFLGVSCRPNWVPPIEGSWLLTSVSAEPMAVQKGGFPRMLKISFEVMASGGLGWNKLIYTPNS